MYKSLLSGHIMVHLYRWYSGHVNRNNLEMYCRVRAGLLSQTKLLSLSVEYRPHTVEDLAQAE